MKKFIILFLLLSSFLYAGDIPIKCYNGITNEYLQTYKASQLEALMTNSEKLLFQEALEKKQEIYIKLSDNIYSFTDGVYTGYIHIIWGKEEYKKLTIKTTLTIIKTEKSWYVKLEEQYAIIAEILLPIVVLLLCFAI